MAVEYETMTYPMARICLRASRYQRKEVEEMLQWFKEMDHTTKQSIQLKRKS